MSPWTFIFLFFLVVLGLYAYECSQDINRYIREIDYKGHKYLIHCNRGICHSPECECQTKGE